MFKTKRNVLYLVLGILTAVLLVNFSLGSYLAEQKQERQDKKEAQVEKIVAKDTFSYKGEEGKDALSLLKSKTTVSQNNSGLVVAISGRKANGAKHEFWAFYINGKMAEVGPAEYITKDGDKVAWKIEKY